jgi:hypothetical protein
MCFSIFSLLEDFESVFDFGDSYESNWTALVSSEVEIYSLGLFFDSPPDLLE